MQIAPSSVSGIVISCIIPAFARESKAYQSMRLPVAAMMAALSQQNRALSR
jgi:hypothetical protein